MFTSRAEYRLLLRIDNADLRLTERGREVGLVDDRRWARFRRRQARFETNLERVSRATVTLPDGTRVRAAQALRRQDTKLEELAGNGRLRLDVAADEEQVDMWSVETHFKYAGYLERQNATVERARRMEGRRIPRGFSYEGLPGLSLEIAERLGAVQPETTGSGASSAGRDAGGGRADRRQGRRIVDVSEERLADRLRSMGERAGLTLEDERWTRLAAYVALLFRWNEHVNLTALDSGDRGLERLVIEPLLAARHVPAGARSMVDIGSGGGSPAIPMKIARPGLPSGDGREPGSEGGVPETCRAATESGRCRGGELPLRSVAGTPGDAAWARRPHRAGGSHRRRCGAQVAGTAEAGGTGVGVLAGLSERDRGGRTGAGVEGEPVGSAAGHRE